MSRRLVLVLTLFALSLWVSQAALASAFDDAVRGRIVLDVEQNGEAWYVYPETDERYFLSRPDDAFAVMRTLGLGITNADLERIPVSTSSANIQRPASPSPRSITPAMSKGFRRPTIIRL